MPICLSYAPCDLPASRYVDGVPTAAWPRGFHSKGPAEFVEDDRERMYCSDVMNFQSLLLLLLLLLLPLASQPSTVEVRDQAPAVGVSGHDVRSSGLASSVLLALSIELVRVAPESARARLDNRPHAGGSPLHESPEEENDANRSARRCMASVFSRARRCRARSSSWALPSCCALRLSCASRDSTRSSPAVQCSNIMGGSCCRAHA
jgi:hypothetical protein